jgi:hypothetical protein
MPSKVFGVKEDEVENREACIVRHLIVYLQVHTLSTSRGLVMKQWTEEKSDDYYMDWVDFSRNRFKLQVLDVMVSRHLGVYRKLSSVPAFSADS